MATLDTVVIKITEDSKGIEKTISQLEKVGKVDRQNAASFKKTSKEQAKAMDFVKGKALQMGAALLGAFAIKAVVSGAINILKDFEKELSTLQSITGSTTEEMEFFVKAAKEIGVQTKTSATEVVKAFTLIGSAQPELLKNSKALAEVTKQALILGKAAGINATDAAIALTSAMNQFGASAKDAAKFTDIFATSQQKGSSFIRDTSEALINAGAAASAAGLSFETTNAAIQALAKGAIVGARSGTALRGVLSKLSSQSDDKINPSMIGLGKTLRVLQSRNLDLAKATKLVGEEGATGLLTLIKQIDIFEELDGNLNETGNAMEQMRINTDNLKGSTDELSNAYERLTLKALENQGILNTAAKFATSLLQAFNGTGAEAFALGKQFGLTGSQLSELRKEMGTWGDVVIELQGRLDSLNLEQTEFGAVTKTNVEGAFSMVEILEKWNIVQAKLNGTFEEATEEEKKQAITIGDLKKELIKLRKAQDSLIPGSKELAINMARIAEIQALLKGEINKSIGVFDKLKNKISELKKELSNQAIAGNINKKSLDELEESVKKLERAEIDLEQAISGSSKAMKLQELNIEGVGDAQVKSVKLSGETVLSQLADEEETRDRVTNKRLNALNIVSQAEQQAFSILAQINTNKLIAIDNEETTQLRALENLGLGEEELAKRTLEIQKKAEVERAKILTKQAKQDKAAALIQAAINTAVEVTKVISNPILAAFVALLGAAEIAAIAAQPIPVFHEGKKAELKEGEIFAKILKTESVIPPEQSKKYKGAIDSMIDKNYESYVMKEYMLPIMKSMMKKDSIPFDDMNIWNMQNKQLKAMREGNILTSRLLSSLGSSNNRRTWN